MKKILGLIVEFNPLHNGHIYYINKAKEQVKPDITIAVVSSSFTMRGDIMIMNKFDRTKFMLAAGIDIVLELPFLSAVQSSDYFSYNAINILNCFNITHLAFGAELDNLEKLKQIQKVTLLPEYDEIIKQKLSKGHSYPNSALNAFKTISNDQELTISYSLPNNTLGLGYLNAIDNINDNIIPVIIKREGSSFYETAPTNNNITSANAIREMMNNKENYLPFIPEYLRDYQFIDLKNSEDNLLLILKYLFSIEDKSSFNNYLGVNEGIENRIYNLLPKANTYHELIKLLETKRYTPNRIKRTLLHIILKTPKGYEDTYPSYLRILGMNSQGERYINSLNKDVKEKIFTSPKNLQNNDIIYRELKATKLYSLITNNQDLYLEEFKLPIKI